MAEAVVQPARPTPGAHLWGGSYVPGQPGKHSRSCLWAPLNTTVGFLQQVRVLYWSKGEDQVLWHGQGVCTPHSRLLATQIWKIKGRTRKRPPCGKEVRHLHDGTGLLLLPCFLPHLLKLLVTSPASKSTGCTSEREFTQPHIWKVQSHSLMQNTFFILK